MNDTAEHRRDAPRGGTGVAVSDDEQQHSVEAVAVVDQGHFHGSRVRCRLLCGGRPYGCARRCARLGRWQMQALWRKGVPDGPARIVFDFLSDLATRLLCAAAALCPAARPVLFWLDILPPCPRDFGTAPAPAPALLVTFARNAAWVFVCDNSTDGAVLVRSAELVFSVSRSHAHPHGGRAMLVLAARLCGDALSAVRSVAATWLHGHDVAPTARLVRQGETRRLLARLRHGDRAAFAQTNGTGSAWHCYRGRIAIASSARDGAHGAALLVPTALGGVVVQQFRQGLFAYGFTLEETHAHTHGGHGGGANEVHCIWARKLPHSDLTIIAMASCGTDVLWCLTNAGRLWRMRISDGTQTAVVAIPAWRPSFLRHAMCLRPIGAGRVVCCVDAPSSSNDTGANTDDPSSTATVVATLQGPTPAPAPTTGSLVAGCCIVA